MIVDSTHSGEPPKVITVGSGVFVSNVMRGEREIEGERVAFLFVSREKE